MSRRWGLALAFALASCVGDPGDDATGRLRAVWSAASAGPVSVTATPDGRTRTAFFRVPSDASTPIEEAARGFVDAHAAELGLASPGDVAFVEARPFGALGEIAIFELRHRGVPVFGAGLRVVRVGGAFRFALVRVPPAFERSATPALDAAAIVARVAELHGMPMTPAVAPRLVFFDRELLARGEGTGGGGAPVLAWSVDVASAGPVEDTAVHDVLSAEDGAVLLQHPLVADARDRRVFDGRVTGYQFEVIQAARNQWFDEAGEIAGVTVDPSAMDAWNDAWDAHLYAGRNYNFWLNTLGMDSFDDAGAPIRVFVNRDDRRADPRPTARGNARWYGRWAHDPAGEYSGAFLFDLGMVAEDVFAHEYAHAVMDFATSAPPVYANESGAVEESLADAFAALQDEAAPWTVGEATAAGVVRDYADPHASTPWQPACYAAGERFVATPAGPCDRDGCPTPGHACVEGQCLEDAGGVHVNSSLGNRALYLMSQGADGVPFDDPCVLHEAPPIADRQKLVAFYTLAVGLLDAHVSYSDLRAYLLAACRLLAEAHVTPLGSSSEVAIADCASVINAFASVGIGRPDGDLDGWDDREDNCAMVPNGDQTDTDGDDRGDACDDDAPECGSCPPAESVAWPACPDVVEVDSVDADPSITTFTLERFDEQVSMWRDCSEPCNYTRGCFYATTGTDTFFAFTIGFDHIDNHSGRPVGWCRDSRPRGWVPASPGAEPNEVYLSPTHGVQVRLRSSGSGAPGEYDGAVWMEPARREAFMASLMAEVEPLARPCP